MELYGKEFKDYMRVVWLFMVIDLVIDIIQLFLFKYGVIRINGWSPFYLLGFVLLIILGAVTYRRGFNKRQTLIAGLLCFITGIWLAPFITFSLRIPLGYKLISLGILYLENAVLYSVLVLIGWLVSSVIWRRQKLTEVSQTAGKAVKRKINAKKRK